METCPRGPSCGDKRNYSDIPKGYSFYSADKIISGLLTPGRGENIIITSSCPILKENIMSSWLYFLVPVQFHYTEIFKGAVNTSYKQEGEYKIILGSVWGSLNFEAGYK